MKDYIIKDEWNIIEEGFDPAVNKISESIFSIGNGRMGQRANFEEQYTGDTLQGSYVAGVYYPDKTRVGWWKNGYPAQFEKIINAANWIGLGICVAGETLDLAKGEVLAFKRVLNMREGYLMRTVLFRFPSGKEVSIASTRFCSLKDDEGAAIRYSISPLNFTGTIEAILYIDGDVKNQDANYDEKFWEEIGHNFAENAAVLTMCTKKNGFWVSTAMSNQVTLNGVYIAVDEQNQHRDKYVAKSVTVSVLPGDNLTFYKYAVNLSSANHATQQIQQCALEEASRIATKGFDRLLAEQAAAWAKKWEESDICIEGDVAAQQAIRFNIFQLNQTYTGEDDRLNIGPKGFTGEKYGGSTYWDTEAYCLPFYLATAEQKVARNLLIYRYKHLLKAIENAAALGFLNGAALYPMVTLDGTECHNEWEITFEEIHRNGAIAFAIFNYIRYTGDESYLAEFGLEVLVAIARFWAQRVNWSDDKQQYVMLGVTGPNEYENNVNNNWYSNTIAAWCLEYTIDALSIVRAQAPQAYRSICRKIDFDEIEVEKWRHILEAMYYPKDKERGVFLQQDGFLDKELRPVAGLLAADRPLNQHWSWDRILRSCYIKQADVLQGIYLLEDRYDLETIRRNFDFYEPLTVHESSLSPCIHAVIAAKLGDEERAYAFYLRTARLDLDDYNNDTEDGLHITSMAGTWISIVEGFAGMRVHNGQLLFHPMLPRKWDSYRFTIRFRDHLLTVSITKEGAGFVHKGTGPLSLQVYGQPYTMIGQTLMCPLRTVNL